MSDTHVHVADFGLARVLSSNHVIGTRTMQRRAHPGFRHLSSYEHKRLMSYRIIWRPSHLGDPYSHFQIVCKVAAEGNFPKLSHLHLGVQRICGRMVTEREGCSSSTDILQSLVKLQQYAKVIVLMYIWFHLFTIYQLRNVLDYVYACVERSTFTRVMH